MELSPLPLKVAGIGAVSPAGWGAAALAQAVGAGVALAHEEVSRTPGALRQRLRRVPRAAGPPVFAREPRLRRTSPISGFLVAAALEALGPARAARVRAGTWRLGILVTLLNGCVGFSRRFYGEVLDNPSTASPLLFPETVFNAPSSHLAALLGSSEMNNSLVGDTAAFVAALDMAALWLEGGDVDGVLLAAAEEVDWLSSEASALFDEEVVVAEGAAALYLELADDSEVSLQQPLVVGPGHTRSAAAHQVREAWRAALGTAETKTLLCDGRLGARRSDVAEAAAFGTWAGPRLSPGVVLGDGLGVRSAWQCVVAAMAVADRRVGQALVPAIGTNQQALGVLFSRSHPDVSP